MLSLLTAGWVKNVYDMRKLRGTIVGNPSTNTSLLWSSSINTVSNFGLFPVLFRTFPTPLSTTLSTYLTPVVPTFFAQSTLPTITKAGLK